MTRLVLFIACLTPLLGAADADLQTIADALSVDRYTTTQKTVESMGLGKYGGALYDQKTRGRKFDGTIGDLGNQETRKFLVESFSGFGLTGSIQGKYLNFIAQQTGVVNPQNIIVLCAHYDTKGSNTPGGDGDASGVASVVECARVLSQYSLDNTIRYIVFNAAARNFKGSNDYVRNVFGVGKEKLVGVIDVDQILHPHHDKNPSTLSALTVNLGARPAAAVAWATAFVAAAQKFVPALPIDPNGPYNNATSDHYSFVLYGFTTALRLGENAGGQVANAALNTVNDASDLSAGANYDYVFATNATCATAAFVAQQAGFEGPAVPPSTVSDTDGDGYSDEIETVLLSDPNDPASTPLSAPPVVPARALDTLNMTISLNFSLDTSDIIGVRGSIPIKAGLILKGQEVIVDVGGVVKELKLNAVGTGTKRTNTFILKVKKTKDFVPAQLAVFAISLGNGNFKRLMAKFGLVNGNFPGRPVTVPVTVILDGSVFTTARGMVYSSTTNSGGIAH